MLIVVALNYQQASHYLKHVRPRQASMVEGRDVITLVTGSIMGVERSILNLQGTYIGPMDEVVFYGSPFEGAGLSQIEQELRVRGWDGQRAVYNRGK